MTASRANDRIRVLRPVLIVLIVTVHIPFALYRPDMRDVALSVGSYLSVLISGCIAVAALPTLSVFSGYLAGKKAGERSYPAYAWRKFKRLIIPMFLWGLPMAIWIYSRQAAGVEMRPSLDLYPFNPEGWFRALAAYQKLPANPPLYFLRELFLAALLLPVWRLVSRNVLASLLLAAGIYYCTLARINFGFFHRIDIYMYFFIGVFIAAHPGLASADGWIRERAAWVMLVFLGACSAVPFYGLSENPQHYWLVLNLLRLTGPIAFLALATYLARGAIGDALARLAPASYTVFLGHIIVIQIVWWGWGELVGPLRFNEAWWGFFVVATAFSFATLASAWWAYDRTRVSLSRMIFGQARSKKA